MSEEEQKKKRATLELFGEKTEEVEGAFCLPAGRRGG